MRHDRHRDPTPSFTLAARRLRLACGLALLALTAASAPALALPQRGHEYGFFFAGAGSRDGQLQNPGAVAVSETGPSAGDLYVLDRANNRIEQYGPKGEFISAWGWGVGPGKKYEVCTSECHAGIAGAKKDQLNGNAATAIAVDNSSGLSQGDIYLSTEGEIEKEAGYEQIDKFTASGEPIETITQLKYLTSEPVGKTEKERKKEEKELTATEELEAPETHGLTVAPDGTVWLYYEEDLYQLATTSLKTPARTPLSFSLTGEPATGLAVDAQHDFYLAEQIPLTGGKTTTVISKWKVSESDPASHELEELTQRLDPEQTTGVAVDARRDDVYLDNVRSLAAFDASSNLLESFGENAESEPVLSSGAGIATDAASRNLYVADAATGKVDVFTPEKPAAPTIETLSAQEVSDVTAQLDATIDPRGATEQTTWYFQYGTAPCSAGACTSTPSGRLGGPGFADEGFGEQALAVRLGAGTSLPLAPSTTYHYRVVAENAEHGQTISAERSFSTPPAAGTFIADERVWEMVSPADQQGADVDPVGTEFPGPTQAASGGDALTYTANAPFAEPEGNRSIETTQILSTRGEHGWSSKDIVTPSDAGTGLILSQPSEYMFFSPDLSLSLLTPFQGGGMFAEPPLAPPLAPHERELQTQEREEAQPERYAEKTIYMRDDEPLQPQGETQTALYDQAATNGKTMSNPGYLALVTGLDAPGAQFGGQSLHFADATPDLAHVTIESEAPLVPGEARDGLYEWSTDGRGGGTLAPVNTLEASSEPKTFLSDSYLGGISNAGPTGARSLAHAISADGSRLFWTAVNEAHGTDLYMRQMAGSPQPETIKLDLIQPKATGEGPQKAVFQAASADGSRVFFTDEQALTEDAGAGEDTPDLYVCEIIENKASHKLECALEDLTPRTSSGESADVQDGAQNSAQDIAGVLGAGEDGSTVYFVADGVLSEAPNARGEAARPGHCGTEGYLHATCNLYERHFDAARSEWEAPRFIAALSSEDEPDWAGKGQGHLTSRVSPDGRYLAFMSDRPLTSFEGEPYDTDASSPAAHDAPAEEVYEYDSQTGRLVCASCEPSGARPVGVLDPARSQSAASLLVDESGRWQGRWLAGNLPEWPGISTRGEQAVYQNRVLSDSGRLFFDSPEPLVPQDKNGVEDVYEYEPLGVPHGPHQCTADGATFTEPSQGCVGLISSGTSTSESAFLDASETGGEGEHAEELAEGGGDVFFVTAEKLAPADLEGGFDAYDAHECTAASPCLIPPEEKPPPLCQSTEACHPYTPPAPSSLGAPASAGPGAAGNLTPEQAVLPSKTKVAPKPLTRAQKLNKALAACRKRHRHANIKRATCEKQARKRYGPAKNPRKATSKGKR